MNTITVDRPDLKLQAEIQFRLAQLDDLPKLEWHGQYSHFRNIFQATYADQVVGNRSMLLADVNHFPVGQVFILHGKYTRANILSVFAKRTPHLNYTKRGYLYALRVMDNLQNLGIGTQLILQAETILRNHACGWAAISVAKDNQGAHRLYERLGYKIYKEDQGIWSYINHVGEVVNVHEPCWMLEKRL